MRTEAMLAGEFATLSDLIRGHAEERPDKPAMICEDRSISYATLDAMLDRVAAALQREGLARNEAVAILGASSIEYACAFFGALRDFVGKRMQLLFRFLKMLENAVRLFEHSPLRLEIVVLTEISDREVV